MAPPWRIEKQLKECDNGSLSIFLSFIGAILGLITFHFVKIEYFDKKSKSKKSVEESISKSKTKED